MLVELNTDKSESLGNKILMGCYQQTEKTKTKNGLKTFKMTQVIITSHCVNMVLGSFLLSRHLPNVLGNCFLYLKLMMRQVYGLSWVVMIFQRLVRM